MKSSIKWLASIVALSSLLLFPGCQSFGSKKSKKYSTIGLFLESSADDSFFTRKISVNRSLPFQLVVNKSPFLDEGDVYAAKVVNTIGGFAIQLQFDEHGTLVLQDVTTAHSGQHIAIFSQFGPSRWIAAPLITHAISKGVFTFTPDASRAEAQRIVDGLNRLAKKNHPR